jgi:hemolysin activation/secretion protein
MNTAMLLSLAALVAAPATLSGVSAASPPDVVQDNLLIDRNRADRRPTGVPETQANRLGLTETPTVAFTPFVLRAVAIDGSRLDKALLERAVQPFAGQTLDAEGVARLRVAVASAYAGSPWALPIVSLDISEASRGVVRITAIEGRVSHIQLKGDVRDGDTLLLQTYAAALMAETPLGRARAERYLSLIGDIPGVTVATRANPGRTPGGVDLDMTVKRQRWAFDLGIDTRGSRVLGRTQFVGSAALNGAFRMGDQTRVTVILPAEVERFQYLSLSHRQPLGFDGAAVTGSLGYLRTRPPNGVAGDAVTGGLNASWPMIRSYRTNLVLTAGIDGVNSDQAVFGERIATERTRVVRASAAGSRVGERSTVSASLTLSQGLDGLGARAVSGLTDLDFRKINARIEATRALGSSVRLTAAATGQHSPDAAPSSEQFALGGADFGRGFPTALVAGDSGWGVRAEAAWRPRQITGRLAGSEVYAFGDTGEATLNDRPAVGLAGTRQRLSSAGAGVRVALGQKTRVDLEAARALDDPRPTADRWRLNLGLSTRY